MKKGIFTLISALGLFLVVGFAWGQYPEVSIHDIQFVSDPMTDDDSPLLGDTVQVVGVAVSSARDVGVGARWSVYIQDTLGGPWSGLMVLQNDTTESGTLITSVQIGYLVRYTGVVNEYPPTGLSATQLELITSPSPIAVDPIGPGFDIPPIITVNADSLDSADTGEKYESQLVYVADARVINNDLPGNRMLVRDATGDITCDDHFSAVYLYLQGGGSWPPNNTVLNITGMVRNYQTYGFEGYTLNPRTMDDLENISSPPVISDLDRTPPCPTSSEIITIQATVTDNGTVEACSLHYSVDYAQFQHLAMTSPDSVYSASIPAQTDGAFVRYFITAWDDNSEKGIAPGDTSEAMFFYTVRDAGPTIYDLQWTPFVDDASGYEGLEMTVMGIVVTDTTHFSYYFIQDGNSPWSGIWVNDAVNNVVLGDSIEVTGTVQESYEMTRLTDISTVTVITPGNPVPSPVVVNTGDIMTGAATAEQWESILVQVDGVTVTDPFPDSPSNYGEFVVDDGSGGVLVDDSGNFNGNNDSTFHQGDTIEHLRGVLFYTFYNFKIEPRDTNDVINHLVVGVELTGESGFPQTFTLKPNYPNPFNPVTLIQYGVPEKSRVSLKVYNILGQEVATLVNGQQGPGWFTVPFRATHLPSGIYFYRLQAGVFSETHKMILLK